MRWTMPAIVPVLSSLSVSTTKRVLKKMFSNTVGFSVVDGVSGILGASILDGAGYSGYDLQKAGEAGLVGGAIVGMAVGTLQASEIIPFQYRDNIDQMLSIASPALSGVIGYAILKSLVDIDLTKTVAALSLGGGIFSAVNLALKLTFMIGACCLVRSYTRVPIDENNNEINLGSRK
jgi:hypothetical protein